MNLNSIKSNKEYYRRRLTDLEIIAERARERNEMRQRLIVEREELEVLFKDINEYCQRLKELRSRAIKENDDFRTRRLEHLNNVITEGVSAIFPSRHLKAELICDFKRKNTVKLKLTDEAGNDFRPHINNGKLMQYLISFTAVCGIAKSLGIQNIFIDEAFGVASSENLSKIGDIIREKIEEDGFQIILVSQNNALYMDVPRRQFNYRLDSELIKTNLVSVDDVEDLEESYGGER